ncbi:threonine/homoserine/homoserine lactone efflux protein [Agromyces sp. 3263]|uniref:GAP family protein n=1 Tax=Agromyces sp. 3263 TaxID=2817750 RepID=UPI002863B68F|nr:GAP family protein [Agromyces sp. 3263]MDR6906137.1 threonine/homoserine/homoserine lactone efflux protein [Agromyces sp. 3263]
MLQAIGHILPIALAVAISSVPIMATIVILLSPKGAQTALPFLIGWVLGMATMVTIFTLGAQAIPSPRFDRRPDTVIAIIEILVGIALVVIASIEWRRALRHPSDAMPKWLNSVDKLGPWSAFGIAFALNVRPKGLLLAIAAGLAIRAPDLSVGQAAIVIGIYTVIGASTVAVPVILSLADRKGMEPRLLAMKDWISRNSTTVTALIVILIGVFIIGTGLTEL